MKLIGNLRPENNSKLYEYLLTRSRVIPSCQGDSIIFHNEKFLQLQGILLTHPPKVDKKRELTQHIQ